MNVKQKGSAFEREVACILRAHGYDARRGLQYQSGQIEADVVGLPGYHLECKRVEKLNLHAALEQSKRDAKPWEIPVVIHRRSREPAYITMEFEKFLEVIGNDDKRNDTGLYGECGASDGGLVHGGDRDGRAPETDKRAPGGGLSDFIPTDYEAEQVRSEDYF